MNLADTITDIKSHTCSRTSNIGLLGLGERSLLNKKYA